MPVSSLILGYLSGNAAMDSEVTLPPLSVLAFATILRSGEAGRDHAAE